MIYCDASLIVTALTAERSSEQARDWLARHDDADLAASLWVETEVASALAQKSRQGLLTDDQRLAAFAQWREFFGGWHRVTIIDEHFVGAGALTSSGLRAGDALHLAIVVEQEAELVTRDRGLASIALRLGVKVHEVN